MISKRFPSLPIRLLALVLAFSSLTQAAELPPGRVIDAAHYHLGDNDVDRWPEAPVKPSGFNLDIIFDAKANPKEALLGLTHRDVDLLWIIRLNGKKIGELTRAKDRKQFHYTIPANALKDGENRLNISSRSKDDISVGGATLYDASYRELLNLQPVTVTVVDQSGAHLPARITVTDAKANKVALYYAEAGDTAVRKGVLYTLGKPTRMELPAGVYLVSATHGTEWSMDEAKLSVAPGKTSSVQLSLRRELETPGFVAADTHIHTLTFSGHGDASAEERMVTLAAEGVELAIATDHNHQTDFTPFQNELKLNGWFTSVTGNEVTTQNGHFNSFPLKPGKDIPAYKEEDWVKLVAGIRAKGARVVILNHPRWPDIPRGPFGRFGLNRASGERASGGAFTFDAMELINSGVLQPDPLFICRDWFSLLNHGEKITAVGSSDSHTVDNIVGQGRTYVRSSTDDPAKINVDESCKAFLRGDTTISLGIFADVKVNGSYVMGDTLKPEGRAVEADLRVAAPSWVTPKRAIIFLNGVAVAEQIVPTTKGKPTDTQLRFKLPAPAHDAWLVCVIIGDGVTHPSWATKAKYTFAATNPIYLDADGDGAWRSPAATAKILLNQPPTADFQGALHMALKQEDGIAVQMIAELRTQTSEAERATFDEKVRKASAKRAVLKEFLRYLPTGKK
jgi:hypothetical protein